jgi:hypothetical protein
VPDELAALGISAAKVSGALRPIRNIAKPKTFGTCRIFRCSADWQLVKLLCTIIEFM